MLNLIFEHKLFSTFCRLACHPQLWLSSVFFSTGGILNEVGCLWTLNSGKTRPCFPAESAHYATVWELPTGEHNYLTSDGSEWRGRELGPNRRGRLPTLPASTRPVDVSLGHRWMLFFFFCREGTAAPPWSLNHIVVQHVLQQKEDKQIYISSRRRGSSSSLPRELPTPLLGSCTVLTCLEPIPKSND